MNVPDERTLREFGNIPLDGYIETLSSFIKEYQHYDSKRNFQFLYSAVTMTAIRMIIEEDGIEAVIGYAKKAELSMRLLNFNLQ